MAFDSLLKITLSDVMTRQVVTISAESSVLDAAIKMNSLNIGAIVITDKNNSVIGIFTERDNLNKVTIENKSPADVKISDVMTKDPATLNQDTPLPEAFKIMQEGKFRHVPITDNNTLIGIISFKDLNETIYAELRKALFIK